MLYSIKYIYIYIYILTAVVLINHIKIIEKVLLLQVNLSNVWST